MRLSERMSGGSFSPTNDGVITCDECGREPDADVAYCTSHDDLYHKKEVEELEINLAEYENDETARRREDAHNIRELENEVADLRARVMYLLNHFSNRHMDGEDSTFTFPDGDTWLITEE